MTDAKFDVIDLSHVVRAKRGWFVALGIALILAGILSIIFPHISTLSTEILVGAALLASGVVQIVHAVGVEDWGGKLWQVLIGLLETAGGAILLMFPIAGILTLTAFVAVLFVVEGIVRVYMALRMRGEAGWFWELISAALSIVLGIMLWTEFPLSAIWALGLLVGINILMSGWTLIMLAIAAGQD